MPFVVLLLVAAHLLVLGDNIGAQAIEDSTDPLGVVPWEVGPFDAGLGGVATIQIPPGFRFADSSGARIFMELTENPPGGEIGIIMPPVVGQQLWFLLFNYDSTGYVSDTEQDTLDADAILESLREGARLANEERLSRGWSTVELIGWNQQPYYDQATNNLTWSTVGRSYDSDTINHSVRLLGREGVMRVALVLDPSEQLSTLPAFTNLLTGYTFNSGKKYFDFVEGDKVAAYGLTALIAGGVGTALVQTGFLAKFWKFLVAGIVGLAGVVRAFFAKLFGRREDERTQYER